MAIGNNENYVNFINEYKNLRELWDITSEKYKNKNLRKKAYEKLKKEYNNIDENATVDTVKNRIKNMRTAYRRELKKKIQSEKSGAGVDELYQPNLWYFDALDFLRDFEMPEPGISTVISSDDDCASRSPMPRTKKQRISQNCERNELLRKATRHIENLSQREEKDEADIYAKAWACSYRKLSVEQKLFAKKACDEIFILGQLEKLTLNSVQTQMPTYPSRHTVYRPNPQIISVSDISNSGSISHSTPIHFNQSTSTQVFHVEDADGANGRQYSSFHDLLADADLN